MKMTTKSGNLLPCNSFFNFFTSLLGFRCYSYSNCTKFHAVNVNDDDPKLFLNFVRQQSKLGFTHVENPISHFHRMKSMRPLPSIIDFCILFSAMCKIKPHPPFSTVIYLYRHLHLLGLRPNIYSLNILANCYCRLNFVDFGFSVLANIIKLGFQPDIVTFTTLINGFVHTHQFDKAVHLLNKVVKLGYQPTLVTYGSMFKGLCRSGDNAGALKRQFFKDMEAHGLKPDVIAWSSLLDAMCRNAQIDEAITTMKQMEATGVALDIVTYRILMDGLCEANRLREAVDIFSFLTTKGLHDVRAYTIMIKGFCKEGLLAKADELLKNMEDNKCFPYECTFNTIIKGFIDGKDVRRALELVSLMRNKEFAADNHTISSLVSLLTDPNISDADKDLLKKFFEN